MKKIILFYLFVIPCQVNAQITVTQSSLPVAGTSYDSGVDSAYTATITSGGTNLVWNYAGLQNLKQDTVSWITASTTPYSSTFPTATLATFSASDSSYTYFTGNSAGFYANGFYSYAAGGGLGGQTSIQLSPSYLLIPLPFTYNNTRVTFTRVRVDIDTALPHIRFIHRINQNFHCDGYGSLALPNASYPNTIRVKITETSYDSIWFDALGIGFYLVYGTPTVSQATYYRWLHDVTPGLLLSINADSLGTTTNRSEYFIGSVTTGLTNLSKDEASSIRLSPNPANDYLQFNLPETASAGTTLRIYNTNGKLIRETILSGLNGYGFYVSKMDAGIYFYAVNNAEKIQRGKFEVIH